MIIEYTRKAKCKDCKFHEVIKRKTHCHKHNKQTYLNQLVCDDWKWIYEQEDKK